MPEANAHLIALYRKLARGYDQGNFHGLKAWREEALKRLNLRHGDLVVDLGCGTGLNFPRLQEAVGPQGRIIGVDLTDAMLEQARQRVVAAGWKNVELVQADAASYEFPAEVSGILSTFALTFIPQAEIVIQHGSKALALGGRWVVLDMAWPDNVPMWGHHLLFFLGLSRYGITGKVLKRRPWQTVWNTMQQELSETERQSFWKGFFYLAWGKRPDAPA
ncbi:methyltransferase domain-containing protein [Ktedonosporobacter rubrisoli]|uniref:Methyltransferase domain-containing protein n=1 Tax=Ktedonosporobacter rubrisoli TaxID=2509675 RepID=A0A4P6JLG0_KTERU|nr:class I SAM-dependent methyltransferase [Ktedonosporobacter rubrisoli]QBD75913.1 methyltransferase domain-containing protein [Ktedonosporobacter rubrisoli]